MSDTAHAARAAWIEKCLGVKVQPRAPKEEEGLVSRLGHKISGAVHEVGAAIGHGAEQVGHAVVGAAKDIEQGAVEAAHAIETGVTAVIQDISDEAIALEQRKFMAEMKTLVDQIKKVQDAGLDASHYVAQANALRDRYKDAMALTGNLDRIATLGHLVLEAGAAASDAGKDIARVATSAVEGIGSAIRTMRDSAAAIIQAMDDAKDEKPELVERLSRLDKDIADANKETDRAKRARESKVVNVAAESLLDDATKAAGDEDARQVAYEKALKERYGFAISNPDRIRNTHFDQVYQMFDKVPETDVVQGRMRKLSYKPVNDDGTANAGAAYGGAEIEMGSYGAEDWAYQNPVTQRQEPVNGFSISTLHELGHSIDDRFGIMSGNLGKSGSGGWRAESLDSVAAALLAEFWANDGKALGTDRDLVKGLARKALGGAKVRRPAGMSDADWNKQDKLGKPSAMTPADWAVIETFLDLCNTRRSDQWPWGNRQHHDSGGRCYHEAYPGDWVSYDTAVRGRKITVRDYQWRAPGEFFAELYAYSYFNAKEPPNGVEPALAAYMYGGKAAAPPT